MLAAVLGERFTGCRRRFSHRIQGLLLLFRTAVPVVHVRGLIRLRVEAAWTVIAGPHTDLRRGLRPPGRESQTTAQDAQGEDSPAAIPAAVQAKARFPPPSESFMPATIAQTDEPPYQTVVIAVLER